MDQSAVSYGGRNSVYVGIDPGMHGAVVAIDDAMRVCGVWDMPLVSLGGGKHDFDIPGMAAILRLCQALVEPGVSPLVTLEKAQAMRSKDGGTQGTASSFASASGPCTASIARSSRSRQAAPKRSAMGVIQARSLSRVAAFSTRR